MNIFKMDIVKQSNGKFALWDNKDNRFCHINFESAEALKSYILRQADLHLSQNIISRALDDTYFKICVEDFKIIHGLDKSPQEEAISVLEEMGELVEDI